MSSSHTYLYQRQRYWHWTLLNLFNCPEVITNSISVFFCLILPGRSWLVHHPAGSARDDLRLRCRHVLLHWKSLTLRLHPGWLSGYKLLCLKFETQTLLQKVCKQHFHVACRSIDHTVHRKDLELYSKTELQHSVKQLKQLETWLKTEKQPKKHQMSPYILLWSQSAGENTSPTDLRPDLTLLMLFTRQTSNLQLGRRSNWHGCLWQWTCCCRQGNTDSWCLIRSWCFHLRLMFWLTAGFGGMAEDGVRVAPEAWILRQLSQLLQGEL